MSDTVNLLLLGESGVGKTTFVNSFLNYSLKVNVEDARKNGMTIVAPMTISYTNDRKQHSMSVSAIGSEEHKTSTNEKFKQYDIPIDQNRVRLIDCQGFENLTTGDESLEDAFKQLVSLKKIHGVCFLIKSSLSRMSNLLESYIMQTLTGLDLVVTKNVIFIFTYGRSVGFDLDHAKSVMTGFVESIRSRIEAKIPFNNDNVFCVDNGGFTNLVLEAKGVKFDQETLRQSIESWTISVKECKRLLSYVDNLHPYKFPTSDNSVIKNLEQFVMHKSHILCDIFGENYANVQKCKDLKKNSEEACRLIQTLQQLKFNSSEFESSQSYFRQREMTEYEKFSTRMSKLPNKSKNAVYTADDSHSESKKSKLGDSQGKNVWKSDEKYLSKETVRPEIDSRKMNTTGTDEMLKNFDQVASILKKQTRFIDNVYKTAKGQQEKIREVFLKNMVEFELFLGKNGMENDTFKKQLTSFLSDCDNATKFEKMLQEYDCVKKEVMLRIHRDLTEEEILLIMNKIEKLQHQQEVVNKICNY